MNKTSPVMTGAAAITAYQIAPLITWLLNGCPHPVPSEVPIIVSAGLLMLAHGVCNIISTRLNK